MDQDDLRAWLWSLATDEAALRTQPPPLPTSYATDLQVERSITEVNMQPPPLPTSHEVPSEELPPPATGPIVPQTHVTAPPKGLPIRFAAEVPFLWFVGAHGGAGESTLAGLSIGWMAAEHAWPDFPSAKYVAPCVLVARTNVGGLLAAQTALTQWAASAAGTSVRLVGLLLVADAPGKLPQPLRDLAKVVAGGAPRTWSVPWMESWRLGEAPRENLPRQVSEMVRQLRTLEVR